jgi:hypothetical protein
VKAIPVVMVLVAAAAMLFAAIITIGALSRPQEPWIMWHWDSGSGAWNVAVGVDGFENRTACRAAVVTTTGGFCFPASFNPKKADQ